MKIMKKKVITMKQIKKVEIVTKTGERYGCHAELIPGSGCYTLLLGTSEIAAISCSKQEIDKWIIYND
jgi:hypothetical protein